MRGPSARARRALPPCFSQPRPPRKTLQRARKKPAAPRLLSDSGKEARTTAPPVNGECLWSPPSGAVLSRPLWCRVPMGLVGTRVCSVVRSLGFPSWPRSLERRRVVHLLIYLSLSWAAFGGLVNPKNCGMGHLWEMPRAQSYVMKWDCPLDIKNQEVGEIPTSSVPSSKTSSNALLSHAGCGLGWVRR